MKRFYSDFGIVLKKFSLFDFSRVISVFSLVGGKQTFVVYGVKKTTSRRISHLEVGNYIRFTLSNTRERKHLKETEIVWGFSKTRSCPDRIAQLITICAFLNCILPEGVAEEYIFYKTLKILTYINNKNSLSEDELELFFREVLIKLGYLSKNSSSNLCNPYKYIEEIIGKPFKKISM